MDDTFYTPLSVTGYLTPLQRKKLREKRGVHTEVTLESGEIKKEVKPRLTKRKRETNTIVPFKRQKTIKHREQIPQLQCSVAKVICKTNNVKKKKFFKTSSPNRLLRTNYTMPFIFKKNLFLTIDKNTKENNFKKPSCKEPNVSYQSIHSINENEESSNVTSPYVIRINKFSDMTEDPLQQEPTNEVPEHLRTLFDFDWPSDEILLKRQIEARAEIKRQKLSSQTLRSNKKEEKRDTDEPHQKLYPIFYLASRKQFNSEQKNKRSQKNGMKRNLFKRKESGGEQMVIDAGQKKFGAQVCNTCNMIYSIGVEEDERLHLKYHKSYLINLKFLGWKDENIISEYSDGRVIMVRRNEQSYKIKKLEEILEVANRDLGFPTSSLPSKQDLVFLLFISNAKQVVGCVVAESIESASCVLFAENNYSSSPIEKDSTWRMGNWYSSSETVPAICGINRIWVAHSYRRHKVASRMVDCLRCHFIHGHVIGIRELAFTDPSLDGREFAASYTGTDNFLVYR